MTMLRIRDVSLYVDVLGHGYPLLLMHGGPGADHHTLFPFRRLADQFRLVFYDHRCNGRSQGAAVSTMTWDNLTADADALRDHFGFEKWAVLGHSFGGNVALEYVLRYPERVSRLVLMDTGADSRWPMQKAAELVIKRGHSARQAELFRRWLNGEFAPREMMPIVARIGDLYSSHPSLRGVIRDLAGGEWRCKPRAEPLIYAAHHLLKGWNVIDRLGQIDTPTLVIAGRDDILFPPESQRELAAGIPDAQLQIIDDAGHNPHTERPEVVLAMVAAFLSAADGPGSPLPGGPQGARRVGRGSDHSWIRTEEQRSSPERFSSPRP